MRVFPSMLTGCWMREQEGINLLLATPVWPLAGPEASTPKQAKREPFVPAFAPLQREVLRPAQHNPSLARASVAQPKTCHLTSARNVLPSRRRRRYPRQLIARKVFSFEGLIVFIQTWISDVTSFSSDSALMVSGSITSSFTVTFGQYALSNRTGNILSCKIRRPALPTASFACWTSASFLQVAQLPSVV